MDDDRSAEELGLHQSLAEVAAASGQVAWTNCFLAQAAVGGGAWTMTQIPPGFSFNGWTAGLSFGGHGSWGTMTWTVDPHTLIGEHFVTNIQAVSIGAGLTHLGVSCAKGQGNFWGGGIGAGIGLSFGSATLT